jgi:hypothetical protein
MIAETAGPNAALLASGFGSSTASAEHHAHPEQTREGCGMPLHITYLLVLRLVVP